MNKKRGVLFVVSGPAGTGKGTVCKEVISRNDNIFLSISATTRSPRPGEEHGKQYYFLDKADFEKRIKNGDMLEYAEFCDNYYGTPKQYVDEALESGRDVILEIEVQGAMKVKEIYSDAVFIFILPPSFKELRSRLEGRGTETADVVEKRLTQAKWELSQAVKYDYGIVNDTVEMAVKEFESVILASKCRIENKAELISELAE